MKVSKIGFTGTQRGMTEIQAETISNYFGDGVEFHHGDCTGADEQAHRLAKAAGCLIIIHPPINPNKRAFCIADNILPQKDYLDRNHDIVDATELLLATPGEQEEQLRSGTWATIRYARKWKKPTIIIYPNGGTEL
jgi:hypothetical protein